MEEEASLAAEGMEAEAGELLAVRCADCLVQAASNQQAGLKQTVHVQGWVGLRWRRRSRGSAATAADTARRRGVLQRLQSAVLSRARLTRELQEEEDDGWR